jgi:hypothetical protein
MLADGGAEPVQEAQAIGIVDHDSALARGLYDDMVHGSRSLETRPAWHPSSVASLDDGDKMAERDLFCRGRSTQETG